MARRSYSRTSYPARFAARRRASAPKRKPQKSKSDDYTKWLIVGSAAVLAFFVFRPKKARATVLVRRPTEQVAPISSVGIGRFVRAGTGGELKCFDTSQGDFVQDFFCEQQDESAPGDKFFFPKG
jgi:hypothetical protein